jgi:hypothetical protein
MAEKLTKDTLKLISENITKERTINTTVTCPYCMNGTNKLTAVAGVHGEFVSSVDCMCGKKLRVFGRRTVIIDKVEGE